MSCPICLDPTALYVCERCQNHELTPHPYCTPIERHGVKMAWHSAARRTAIVDLRADVDRLTAELKKLHDTKADEIEAVLARHREAFGANVPQAPRSDLVREMIDRLTRDAEAFRQTRHVSVSDARIRADACKVHSEALAKLLTMARDLADAGHHDRAVALLRGDMPAPKETP